MVDQLSEESAKDLLKDLLREDPVMVYDVQLKLNMSSAAAEEEPRPSTSTSPDGVFANGAGPWLRKTRVCVAVWCQAYATP